MNHQRWLEKYSISSRLMQRDAERCQALNTRKHMQTHSQLLIRSRACSHTLSPQCVQTHAETCLVLRMLNHTQIHAWLLIRADTCTPQICADTCTHSALDTCKHMSAPGACRYIHTHTHTLSHWYTQTHAHTHTRWARDIGKRMLSHENEEAWSALETCKQTLSSQGTCRHTLSSRRRKLNDGARSALETCQQTHLEAHVDDTTWYMQKRAHTRSALDSDHGNADSHSSLGKSKQMQKYAQLLIRAGTCANMPSLGYVHTHAGLQCVHVHAWNSSSTCRCNTGTTLEACKIIHVKHDRANMDGHWDWTYEWNTV
jgi:hypothetical protein